MNDERAEMEANAISHAERALDLNMIALDWTGIRIKEFRIGRETLDFVVYRGGYNENLQ